MTQTTHDTASASNELSRQLLPLIATAAFVAVSAWVGIELTREAGRVASIWLANGLLLGVIVLLPRSRWPAYFTAGYLGNVAANLGTGDPLDVALFLSACNSFEVLLAAWPLASRLNRKAPLTSPKELLHFILWGGIVAPFLTGLLASAYLAWGKPVTVLDILQIWYPADALGIFIVTPLVLSFRLQRYKQRGGTSQWAEFAALLGFVGLVTAGVFMQSEVPLLFLIYAPLLFIVLRHGQLGAAAGIATVATVAIGMTVHQVSLGQLFTALDFRHQIFLVQIFLAVASLLAYSASVMLAQRERLEAALSSNLAEIEKIYRLTPVGLFALDDQLRYVRVNDQMAAINGAPPQAHLGRGLAEMVPSLAATIEAMARPVLESGVPVMDQELRGRTPRLPESDCDWIISVHPLRDPSDRIIGLFGTIVEVTERKQAERQLAQRVKQLEQVNQEMERFNYIVSHDLQSPLRNISSYSGLLEKRLNEKLSENERELLGEISACAKEMRKMIQDLLQHSRVTPKEARFVAVDIEVACKQAMSLLDADITATQAQITHGPLPTVHGDESMLAQLFHNLLGNSIKFIGPAVTPKVHIEAKVHGHEWVFCVSDNGIGLPADKTKNLFKVFQRFHGSRYPGTGIGLAICKRVIDLHGGQIWADATSQSGMSFYFTLPINDAASDQGRSCHWQPDS